MKKLLPYMYILLCYVVAIVLGYLSYGIFINYFNIVISTLLADIVATIVIFIFSIVIDNSSVYDPYWSVIPVFILWLWLHELSSVMDMNSYIIIISVLVWSLRLTINWLINWKGFKHEDWRYMKFRKQFGKLYWLISLLAIHVFPTLIVYLGLLPIYYGLSSSNEPTLLLFIGSFICILGAFISLLADLELIKHRKSVSKSQAIQSGVWKISRHPNYLGELTFWLGCLLIGLSYNIELIYALGFVAMVCLFQFYSIPAMEKRLLQSKANYQDIKRQIPRLIPLFKIIKSK